MLRFFSIRLSTTESTTPKKICIVKDNKDLSFQHPTPSKPLGDRTFELKKTRRLWTEEEDERLKNLYTLYGPRYTFISQQLPGRSVATVFRRCKYFFDPIFETTVGKWQKEELTALRTLVEEAIGSSNHPQVDAMIDWHTIQRRLPHPRELHIIKMTWYHTLNPKLKHGRWTAEETNTLQRLVQQVGINDWKQVSTLLRTRSPRQCLEKYRHQVAHVQKGRFSPKEAADLMAAVNTYGAGDFLLIKRVMSSSRTPRQLSKYYRYALDPAYDRSPWTMTEKREVYNLTLKFDRDMTKVREHMNSRRRIHDMWNHFYVFHRTKTRVGNDARGDQRGKIHQVKTKQDTETEQDNKALPETVD
ncbi:unnamed protein product [Absidia cylindrospora]